MSDRYSWDIETNVNWADLERRIVEAASQAGNSFTVDSLTHAADLLQAQVRERVERRSHGSALYRSYTTASAPSNWVASSFRAGRTAAGGAARGSYAVYEARVKQHEEMERLKRREAALSAPEGM